jgi:hypothetical protein
MEKTRLDMLPEDCQRLIWSKVYDECLIHVEAASVILWVKKFKKQIYIDTDLFNRMEDSDNEDDYYDDITRLYETSNQLLTCISDFVKDLRKNLKSKIDVYYDNDFDNGANTSDSDFDFDTPLYSIEPYLSSDDDCFISSDDDSFISSDDDE